MAGAGYKLFNTGDVLTAAQVNTYLQEQAVMRFANATARTTALSGVLAQGMVSYLDDVKQVQVYNGTSWVAVGGSSPLTTKGDVYTYSTADARLAVGTNGQYLSADSTTATGLKWVTPAGGGSLIKLDAGTISGTSMSFNNVFSSTYDNYLVCWLITNCDGEQRLRFRASGSDNTTANYRYGNMEVAASATPSWSAASGGTGTDFTLGLPVGTGTRRYGFMANILNPFSNSVVTRFTGSLYAGSDRWGFVGGGFNGNDSFDGFTIYNTGSTSSGSYQIYGIAK